MGQEIESMGRGEKREQETGFEPDRFELDCPLTFDQIMDENFWPD